ncbi:sensor histidine kinase [Streptomyces sp. MST-110588]|uniref:sensor histidine kinase n=1 Tax=Streptomyces sp. MST-110588 TaxID=2833628 RepID=UPI001F5CA38C|nr:sensor histidine kinase [Streptomyces sp. MST-110588]UNO42084.1 sensor histidine kinase [Streptomyces sp. MST-110588]
MNIPPWLRPGLVRLRRALPRLRRDLLFAAVGVPLHALPPLLALWALTQLAGLLEGTSDAAPVLLPVALGGMVATAFTLTEGQRWRLRRLCGVDLPRLRFTQARRQFGYHFLAGPLLGVLEAALLALLLAGLAAASVFLWIWALPAEWRLANMGYATEAGYATALGLAAVAVVPPLAAQLLRLENLLLTSLLGVGRAEELARRVEDLTRSRAGAVDAADAERRRIERDLHDGAQQRLVSLALNLGLAKATLTDLPPQARQVIEEAHREAKEAIEELGSLVRGLHPAVLDELGLDAALSGLAARAPLPVRLRVEMDRRAAPAVEAVAYFVVSEALTNIAKHARATRGEVTVTLLGEILRVVIADDGVGGADPSGGSGLKGLAQRVRSVDGAFRVSSPVGGPTVMTVELPCTP